MEHSDEFYYMDKAGPMDYSNSVDKVLDLSQSRNKKEIKEEIEHKHCHGTLSPVPPSPGYISPGTSASPHYGHYPVTGTSPSPFYGCYPVSRASSTSPLGCCPPGTSVNPHHICYPAVPIPLRYPPPPILSYSAVTDSSDDASDSSNSPPTTNTVSSTFMMTNTVINSSRSGKPTRPFKAYPKDLLPGTSDVLLGPYNSEEFLEFRRRMLSQIQSVSNKSNANMKRSNSPQQPTSTGEDDGRNAAYWERRRKNNEAAKRSRDARRAKEDEIAIRAAFLEQENTKLKYEVASLRDETTKLRCLVYKR